MKIFDTYDLEARVSVVIILLTPILIPLYLQVDTIRTIAATAVISVTLSAAAILFVVCIRKRGKKAHTKRDLVAEYLYPDNDKIEAAVKERLYHHLATVDPYFSILLEKKEERPIGAEYKNVCKSALNWLKENSRESNIINKENAMYGFCRNLFAVKGYGITICIVMIIAHIVQYSVQFQCDFTRINLEFLISFAVVVVYLLIWVIAVRKSLIDFSAENYADALIRSFDKKSQTKSNK